MKKLIIVCLLVSCWLAIGNPATAITLTFDDISNTTDYAPVPDGYGGLNWSNVGYWNPQVWGGGALVGTGYDHGTVSPHYVAFPVSGAIATVSDGLFDFNSAYLTGAWNDGLNILVQGLLGSSTLYSQTVVVNTTGPSFFTFNYLGIDKLVLTGSGGTPNASISDKGAGPHFAMDNLTINAPEPSSIALLTIEMIGLAALANRKHRVR